jgi:hypothetical protein
MEKIFTALDYAKKRDGQETVKGRIQKIQKDLLRKGIRVKVGFSLAGSDNVSARIWQGHWIADCECGGAEFVDPKEPIFFCFGCGNEANGNRIRNVLFPENREDIERKILERPVSSRRGLDDMMKAEASIAAISVDGNFLSRSWVPGETIKDLEIQQDAAIKKWKGKKVK